MAGPDLCSIVRDSSEMHYRVSVGHLRDWSAGNEIICHSANALPATCLAQQGSAAFTGGAGVYQTTSKGKVICHLYFIVGNVCEM